MNQSFYLARRCMRNWLLMKKLRISSKNGHGLNKVKTFFKWTILIKSFVMDFS